MIGTMIARTKLPDRSRVVLLAAMLLAGLLALAVGGCSQPAPTVSVTIPTATAPRPPVAAPQPSLPAMLPDASLLPSFVNLELVGSGDEMVSTQHPAYVMAELSGREINSVSLLGGSVLEDGRQRLLFHQPIDPDPGDDEWPGQWANGIHDQVQTWDFTGDYLWDGQRGDFVVLWATEEAGDTRTAHGRYRAAESDSYDDAVLVVDIAQGLAQNVIKKGTSETVRFQPGDEFQLTTLLLDDEGVPFDEPGASLSFEEGGHLAYTQRPVPSGTYFLGISVDSAGGEADTVLTRFVVNNDSLVAGYRAFLDVKRGFQLLYPETWPAPTEQGGRLLFSDPAATVQMSVSSHPDIAGQPIVNLKQRALEAYGDVTLLYEDQVDIGSGGGLRTVYGYQAPDGPRTGVLLTFVHEEMAYVVDVDGPGSEEAQLLDLASVIASGWTGRAVAANSAGHWLEADVDGLAVQVPADHRPQQMGNGWQRFAGDDELTFLAMRSEPVTGRGLFNGLAHWLDVAGSNVLNFAASEIYAFDRGDRSWARVDFEYALDDSQRIGGAIVLAQIGERFLIIWAEAPSEQFQAYEAWVLEMIVDQLSREVSVSG